MHLWRPVHCAARVLVPVLLRQLARLTAALAVHRRPAHARQIRRPVLGTRGAACAGAGTALGVGACRNRLRPTGSRARAGGGLRAGVGCT
jgi:hypothetical protein